MKSLVNIILLIGMMMISIHPGTTPALGEAFHLPDAEAPENAFLTGSGMPGWPIPDKPIPVHEPGRPSRAESYSTQVMQENELGVAEIVSLSGVEAMTADGLDPLAGSYRLVGKDDVAVGIYNVSSRQIGLNSYRDSTISLVPGSEITLAPAATPQRHSLVLTAGDLNGDGVDEQIAAWVDAADNYIYLAIGEMPGTDGRTSSDPAAAANGDQVDLLVRGYDQALWHAQFDGSSWGSWNNNAGGLLLSAPAIASRGTDAFDVFAIGTDNQIYRRQWDGSAWAGSWSGLPADPVFSTIPAWIGPPPELPAPSVIAYGTNAFDVFRLAPDRSLRWNRFNGSAWQGWQGLGGMFASEPGTVLLPDGRLQVFAIGVDQALWYLLSQSSGWEMDGSAYRWQRAELNGMDADVTPVSAPSALRLPSGQIQVFVRGSDDALWQVTYSGSWGAWSKAGGGLASRPAAAMRSSQGLALFAQEEQGSLQYSSDGATWVPLAYPWLPACCLSSPINTGIKSYITALTNPVDQINVIDVATGHFRGDGRQQIALAYTLLGGDNKDDGIGLQLFDITDGFKTLIPLGSLQRANQDYFPKIAVGEFDGDAPQEIALAYATRRGGVCVYEHMNYAGAQIAWLKEGTYAMPAYRFNDVISSLKVSPGWEVTVYNANPPGTQHKTFGPGDFPNLHSIYYEGTSTIIGDTISSVRVTRVGQETISVLVNNGIYNQRNAHVALEIFDVDPQNLIPSSKAIDYYEIPLTDWVHPAPERTLHIVAGDFDGARDLQGKLHDEVALMWDKVWWVSSGDHYDAYFHILDIQPTATGLSIAPHGGRAIEEWGTGLPSFDTFYPYSAEINLATGDFDGDGRDEIVRTWPRSFDDDEWPDLYRNLQVLDYEGSWGLTSLELPGIARFSYTDALAAGDLNRDMKDEIIFYNVIGNVLNHYSYEYSDGSWTLVAGAYPRIISLATGDIVVLASGDFGGNGIRVGAPTYRRQYDVGQVIAVVNAPPKHKDVIDGVLYNLNADQSGTYAQFEQVVGSSTEVSVTTQKDWGVDSTFKLTIGDPEATHTTTSLENSYGQNFSATSGSVQSLTYTQSVGAITDDVLYYTRLDYDVWEYPVYDRLTNTPQGYMSVVWPIGGMQSVVESANTCDGWYKPNHQLMNAWSYPVNATQLADRDGSSDLVSLSNYEIGTSLVDYSVQFSSVSTQQRSHEFELGFAASLEKQIGGESIGLNLGVVSFSTRMPSLYFSSRGHYNTSELSTWKTETSSSTKLSGYFAPIANGSAYRYYVRPYLYWTESDYLVLDYVTDPSSAAFWSTAGANYNRPDPAFIYPWSGGQCNHLWADSRYFTSDISIDPPMAAVGDPVKITATLRNFSKMGNINSPHNKSFKVAFYHGDPASGGVKIGEGTIAIGELGPRAVLSRSIDWVAQGSGDQHIYVVIDPDGVLPEVHEDNNKGYGVLHMDVIDFIDVGQAEQKAYHDITLLLGQSMPVPTLHVPLGAFKANLRIDLRAALDFQADDILGLPFEVVSYQTNWDNPMPGFSLRPTAGNPPGVVMIDYASADLSGFNESQLALYRFNGVAWENAVLSCNDPQYRPQRFPAQKLIAVPVCAVGVFALSDAAPQPPVIEPPRIFLPVTFR
jgi:hypothetical protein